MRSKPGNGIFSVLAVAPEIVTAPEPIKATHSQLLTRLTCHVSAYIFLFYCIPHEISLILAKHQLVNFGRIPYEISGDVMFFNEFLVSFLVFCLRQYHKRDKREQKREGGCGILTMSPPAVSTS